MDTFMTHAPAPKNVLTAPAYSTPQAAVATLQNVSLAATGPHTQVLLLPAPLSFISVKPLMNAFQKTPCHTSPQMRTGLGPPLHSIPFPLLQPSLLLLHLRWPTLTIITLLTLHIKINIAKTAITLPPLLPLNLTLTCSHANQTMGGQENGIKPPSQAPGVHNLLLHHPLTHMQITLPQHPPNEFTPPSTTTETPNLAAKCT
jgi:hypothetical protein